jgi:hypothetical protein
MSLRPAWANSKTLPKKEKMRKKEKQLHISISLNFSSTYNNIASVKDHVTFFLRISHFGPLCIELFKT